MNSFWRDERLFLSASFNLEKCLGHAWWMRRALLATSQHGLSPYHALGKVKSFSVLTSLLVTKFGRNIYSLLSSCFHRHLWVKALCFVHIREWSRSWTRTVWFLRIDTTTARSKVELWILLLSDLVRKSRRIYRWAKEEKNSLERKSQSRAAKCKIHPWIHNRKN